MGNLGMTIGYMRYSLWKTLKGKRAKGHYADVNDIRMYYETYGKIEPLLFLHGGTAFKESYMFQIPFFTKKYWVITVDSRAHGRSTDSEQPLSYSIMASEILGLLDCLNIKKTNLVSWSDGGIIGKEISSIKAPTLVITGKNEELVKEEHTKNFSRTIPNAKLELVSNTGHFCPMEDPKTVKRLINDVLG